MFWGDVIWVPFFFFCWIGIGRRWMRYTPLVLYRVLCVFYTVFYTWLANRKSRRSWLSCGFAIYTRVDGLASDPKMAGWSASAHIPCVVSDIFNVHVVFCVGYSATILEEITVVLVVQMTAKKQRYLLPPRAISQQ